MNSILTLDYELYGDGSGDVFEQMIKPTNRILQILEKHDIKCTIFFEVLEYIKLKDEWRKGNRMGYQLDPILAIEKQIIQAHNNGHDIQLHVHPQWINAKYENNKWNVDLSNWRLGDFSVPQDYSIKDLLKEGKETIENLIHTIDINYKCEILRAGGYNIMPSKGVYEAMIELGLKVDSSVYPGGHETGTLSKYDYRNASISKDFWSVAPNDFSQEQKGSKVIEIPVFALKQRRIKKINLDRLKSFLKNRKSGIKTLQTKTAQKSKIEKIKYLFGKESLTWDFCLFTKKQHKQFIKHINNSLISKRKSFVLIGHPKSFVSEKAFIWLLNETQKKNTQFYTLKEYYEQNR